MSLIIVCFSFPFLPPIHPQKAKSQTREGLAWRSG